MKLLKKYGLHHGLPVFILSWAACYLFSPLIGQAVALYGAARYEGREEKEAELRGFRPFKISTWSIDQFEWKDFLMPWTLAAFNIWIMRDM